MDKSVLVCIICDGKLIDSDSQHADLCACALSCGHVFHRGCVFQWLDSHPTCPICRANVTADDVVSKLYFNESSSAVDYAGLQHPAATDTNLQGQAQASAAPPSRRAKPWYEEYAEELIFGGGVVAGALVATVAGAIASKLTGSGKKSKDEADKDKKKSANS